MKRLLIIFLSILALFSSCDFISSSQICHRACLEKMVNDYLTAVIAHDPSHLTFTKDVKFTENGQRLNLGDGLWNTASGRGKYKFYIADTTKGQVAFIGTIYENGVPTILALRLQIWNQRIKEIESFVARDSVGTKRLEVLGSPNPVFTQTIPKNERMSREDLIRTVNFYFTGLERNDGQGYYPFTDNCNRIENGKQTTNNPDGSIDSMGCKEQFESGFFRFVTRIRDRRFKVVDEARGLVFAFVFFDHAGNIPQVTLTDSTVVPIGVKRPWTWEIAEVFKIENEQIRQVEAVCQEAPYGMNAGWSSWEEGLSSNVLKMKGLTQEQQKFYFVNSCKICNMNPTPK